MSTARAVGPAGEVDVFAAAFAQMPELATYSDSARRVLAVAAALFHRNGAAATSIRDITGRCGLSPGAFYRHFASKDDLLHALVSLGHERMESRIATAVGAAGPGPVPRLAAFVRAYVTGHVTQPELAQLVRREYLHLSPARRSAVVRRRRALRAMLAGLIDEATAAGDLDPLPGPDSATRVAVMLLDMSSRTSEWYHPRPDRPPGELAELYVAAALRLAGHRPAGA